MGNILFYFKHPGLRGLLLIIFGMNTLASLTYFSNLPAMMPALSGNVETDIPDAQ